MTTEIIKTTQGGPQNEPAVTEMKGRTRESLERQRGNLKC